MGVKLIIVWTPRCRWFNPDGSFTGMLPCDPYSRLKYLGKGLRPEIGIPNEHDNTPGGNTLEDAIKGLVGWSGGLVGWWVGGGVLKPRAAFP